MIALDQHIMEFVSNNWLAIGLIMALLKAVAKSTPWAADDSVYRLLETLVYSVKPGKKGRKR